MVVLRCYIFKMVMIIRRYHWCLTFLALRTILSKKYGSVSTVQFGPTKVVILAGYKTVKQVLVNHAEFGDRGMLPVLYDFTNGHGILFGTGESWKEMRHFALANLGDFGMGKKGSEEKILEEIHYLIEVLRIRCKKLDTTQPLNYAVANVISNIVYGTTVGRANDNLRIAGSFSIQLYNMFPWLGPWLKSRKILLKNIKNNKKEMGELVRGLKETLNPQMCRGFVDSFLVRKGRAVAIPDRVKEEISRIIGSRQPLVEDRKNLPYTDAVIHETDITFQGYFIKKGTLVFPLLTSVLQDGSEWESPHTFNPSHFLDEEGRFAKRDGFMPFSAVILQFLSNWSRSLERVNSKESELESTPKILESLSFTNINDIEPTCNIC
uniref:Uncharacterized protein n=1 Tax=Hucho hucho TaxID=62062 RepID=A0A4W5MTV3_9TELE